MMRTRLFLVPLLYAAWPILLMAEPDHEHAGDDELGSINVETSCTPEANTDIQRGLALLHHMMYEQAAAAFAAASQTQSSCALAYWGQAMSIVHPLWSDPPSAEAFQRGQRLVDTALEQPRISLRERAYIDALRAYFSPGKQATERENLLAYARAWGDVHEHHPEDPEAILFYALAQLSIAEPSDKTYTQQRRAGRLIEAVFARYPRHPGAQHYLIHAYDSPPLAQRALKIAGEYGRIAPDVPHALHMPSHIFTRLGSWQESIDWNERSATAALKHPVSGATSLHYLHALDYLAYAYLQRADDVKAKAVGRTLRALRAPVQVELASAYAFAAVPARLALERQRWADAALLEARMPNWYPWDSVPAVESITHFARALGAAHINNKAVVLDALDRLAALRDRAKLASAYWGTQVEIQRLGATAWFLLAQNERDRALATMRQAAELESSTEKHPVTPGEVLPARELLGDMLLELKLYADAQREYEAALTRSPNRFNSLFGAGLAAEKAGDPASALIFYDRLVRLSVLANDGPASDRLAHAKAYIIAAH